MDILNLRLGEKENKYLTFIVIMSDNQAFSAWWQKLELPDPNKEEWMPSGYYERYLSDAQQDQLNPDPNYAMRYLSDAQRHKPVPPHPNYAAGPATPPNNSYCPKFDKSKILDPKDIFTPNSLHDSSIPTIENVLMPKSWFYKIIPKPPNTKAISFETLSALNNPYCILRK